MKALLLLAFVAVASATVSYEGYKVLSVTPRNEKQLEFLRTLKENGRIDFWHFKNTVDIPADVMVPPEAVDVLVHTLSLHGMNTVILNHNVQADIDAERERLANKPPHVSLYYDYDDFNDFDTIMTELDALVARCPAGFTCNLETLPQSTYEGRPLKLLSIGTGGRPAHWVDATIHAREWLATATVMNVINRIFDQADDEAIGLLANNDWYFLPVMNPDGYEYSWTTDRLWRKNRGPTQNPACTGTDLNRNYDQNWSGPGASDNPCADTYYGDSAASEPETQETQNKANEIASQPTYSWNSFHTYGYYWLWPYGDCSLPERWQDIEQVADALCAAVAATFNTNWDCGNSCQTLYATSGGTIDYTLDAGITYSYVPELRGNGFVVPPSEIAPSFEEVWNGMVAMVAEIASIEGTH